MINPQTQATPPLYKKPKKISNPLDLAVRTSINKQPLFFFLFLEGVEVYKFPTTLVYYTMVHSGPKKKM